MQAGRRKFELKGDKLIIVTKPQPIGGTGARAKALVSCKLVWERQGTVAAFLQDLAMLICEPRSN